MNLNEFGAWGLERKSVANPEPNNKYLGECVSLIQQYLYNVLGEPFKAHGNAKDWATNYPKNVLRRLEKGTALQRGDILVYGKNRGHGYGHLALIDVNFKFYDQNGQKSKAIAYSDNIWNDYVCILRPINQEALGLNPVKYRVTAKIGLNIRAGRGTGYAKLGTYAKDEIIEVSDIINGWAHTEKGYVSANYIEKV